MLGTVLAKFGKAFQNDRENDRVQGWSWNIK
jgi:hypothetical protein